MRSKKSKKTEVPIIDDIEDKEVKEKITTLIDFDILKWLRGEAEKKGIGYQTLLNMKLRESMQGSADDHIRHIVREEMRLVRKA